MKKRGRALAALLSLLAMLSGCGEPALDSSSSSSFSSDCIDGGEHGQVAWTYLFDTFERYCEFYQTFKGYNAERYWVPRCSGDASAVYSFMTLPISLDDVRAKRYDLRFKGQEMGAKIQAGSVEVELRFEVQLPLLADRGLGGVSYGLSEEKEGAFNVSFFTERTRIAGGILVSIDGSEETINNFLEKLVASFERSKDYVF